MKERKPRWGHRAASGMARACTRLLVACVVLAFPGVAWALLGSAQVPPVKASTRPVMRAGVSRSPGIRKCAASATQNGMV